MGTYKLRAGVGRAVIKLPDELFPIEGFTGIHDELCSRILLLENRNKIAIVSLELTSLPVNEIEILKKLVSDVIDFPPENVWICVTHTFSAPHIQPDNKLKNQVDYSKNMMLCKAIRDSLREAAIQAFSNINDAYLGFGRGYCLVNINRDIPTIKGWWIGRNESGPSDKTVNVIRINNLSGRPIAFLFNYGIQSSVMDGSVIKDGGRLVTGDLVGQASRYIESKYDRDFVAMFCLGAAGDQAPKMKAKYVDIDLEGKLKEIDIHENGYELVKQLGEELGSEVVRIAEKIECTSLKDCISLGVKKFKCPGQKMPHDIYDIHPTKEYSFIPEGDREVTVQVIKIDDIVLVGVMPELNCCTAMELKEFSPFEKTLVITMVNGGSKYMPDKESYKRITYESMNSSFGQGSAEILRDKALELLREMK